LYCLFEKKLSVDEIQRITEIERPVIEKILKLNENSEHKRLLAQKPGIEE
jgi:NAD+ synthase